MQSLDLRSPLIKTPCQFALQAEPALKHYTYNMDNKFLKNGRAPTKQLIISLIYNYLAKIAKKK